LVLHFELCKLGKLNSLQLEKNIPFLIARDGDLCQGGCNRSISSLPQKVQVGHKDGNVENNPKDLTNYFLICAECNKKQYKQRRIEPFSDRPMTPEMERREILKPLFQKEVNHRILQRHSCCLGEAVYDVTMVIGSSVQFGRDMIKQEIGTNGIGAGSCGSPLCKKKHIYLKDEVPQDEG